MIFNSLSRPLFLLSRLITINITVSFDTLQEDVKKELFQEINDKIEFLAYKQKNKDK